MRPLRKLPLHMFLISYLVMFSFVVFLNEAGMGVSIGDNLMELPVLGAENAPEIGIEFGVKLPFHLIALAGSLVAGSALTGGGALRALSDLDPTRRRWVFFSLGIAAVVVLAAPLYGPAWKA